MKQEYKNRIWKYFLEQKAYEVLNVVGYLLVGYMLIVGIPIAVGRSVGDGMCSYWGILQECSIYSTWFEGAFYLIIVSLVSWGIFKWFESNWWHAKWKVEEEIAEQKKKKRRKKQKMDEEYEGEEEIKEEVECDEIDWW